MDDLDNILTNIDLEEEKSETEEKDWDRPALAVGLGADRTALPLGGTGLGDLGSDR